MWLVGGVHEGKDPSPRRPMRSGLCPTKFLEVTGIGDLEVMATGQVGFVSWVGTQRYLGSEPQSQ